MSEDWDFYFCCVEDKPASILVDLGIHAAAPLPELEEMVWLRLSLRQPREDGLSGEEEFARLNQIEDALAAAASEVDVQIAYVGRNTSDGCRVFYFYAANGLQTESRLSSAMVPFPEYRFETGSRGDPEWSGYFEFLYPSKREHQTILNGRVLGDLEKHGDKHEIEREVAHWIYFESPQGRADFLQAALQKGYRSVDQSDRDGPMPFGLTVARVHAVDFTTIDDVVLGLFDLAKECGGDYAGWETSVQTGREPDNSGEGKPSPL